MSHLEKLFLPCRASHGIDQSGFRFGRRVTAVASCPSAPDQIALALGRHQHPSIGTRKRMQREIAGASGSPSRRSRRSGTISAPTVDVTLRASVAADGVIVGTGAAQPVEQRPADRQPARHRNRIDATGHQQDRTAICSESGGILARASPMPRLTTYTTPLRAITLRSLRPSPVPPMPTVASASSLQTASSRLEAMSLSQTDREEAA